MSTENEEVSKSATSPVPAILGKIDTLLTSIREDAIQSLIQQHREQEESRSQADPKDEKTGLVLAIAAVYIEFDNLSRDKSRQAISLAGKMGLSLPEEAARARQDFEAFLYQNSILFRTYCDRLAAKIMQEEEQPPCRFMFDVSEVHRQLQAAPLTCKTWKEAFEAFKEGKCIDVGPSEFDHSNERVSGETYGCMMDQMTDSQLTAFCEELGVKPDDSAPTNLLSAWENEV